MILEIKSFQFLVNEKFFLKIEFLLSLWNLALFHWLFKKHFFQNLPSFQCATWGGTCTIGWPRWREKVVVQVRGVCRVSQASTSALAAVQKPHRRWPTYQRGTSHSGGWMSKLKTSADVMSDENSLLVHWRYLLTASSPGGRGRGSRTQGQESSHEAPSSWPPLLPKAQDLSVHSS